MKASLLTLIEETARGVLATPERVREVRAIVDMMEEKEKEREGGAWNPMKRKAPLSANWRLLFTSEQETLFILQNARLFGTEAGEVIQVVDDDAGILQNVITFGQEGGRFQVDSTLAPDGDDDGGILRRRAFKFTSAGLRVCDADGEEVRTLAFPPFGQGWFDSVYCDGEIRCAKDSRGDVLVVERTPLRPFPKV